MTQNDTKFKWNSQRQRAASLVAENNVSDEEIASQVKVGRKTLHRWKSTLAFQAEVQRIVNETREQLIALGIIAKQNRLDALNERWKRLKAIIDRRAEEMKDVPGGGSTGLLVRRVKGIGSGEDFQIVEMYAVDTGLLKEMREIERQVAIELGEWQERRTNFNVDLKSCTDDQLERIANGEDPARVLASARAGAL